jgi:hypothetical protein
MTHCRVVNISDCFGSPIFRVWAIQDEKLHREIECCKGKGNGKGKFHPVTGHEVPEGEYRYSSTLSLTLALDGVGDQRHAPTVLLQGKTRYPLCRGLGGLQGRSGRVQKILPHRDSIPGQPGPLRVAIPTELSRPNGMLYRDRVAVLWYYLYV